jgi:D-alanine-D-alanine ligase
LKKPVKVALVYTSKSKAREIIAAHHTEEGMVVEEEEPPDLLAEYDTKETVEAVKNALAKKYDVIAFEADGCLLNKLQREKPFLVFNISEGFKGKNRESYVPIICEMLNIPYTGSDGITLGICLDKARTKEILAFHKIPTPAFAVINKHNRERVVSSFPLPAIVKPLAEGSSKGIGNKSLAVTRSELKENAERIISLYKQSAIAESFLYGREFTVGVLGNYPHLEVLPPAEIDHSVLPEGANPIYGYEAKWVWDTTDKPLPILVAPANISKSLKEKIRQVALKTVEALDIKDWCRIDIRLDKRGVPNVLELNPLPGILPDPKENSALPACARAAGYRYDELILKVAEIALERYGLMKGKR